MSDEGRVIQGASGNQYMPMDTSPNYGEYSPQQPSIAQLAQQLTTTFNQLIHAITQLQAQTNQPVSSSNSAQTDLVSAVDTVLQQADWFTEKVDRKVGYMMEDQDFSYEIEAAVELHFENSFRLSNHVDINELVHNEVEDRVQESIEEKFRNITITFD